MRHKDLYQSYFTRLSYISSQDNSVLLHSVQWNRATTGFKPNKICRNKNALTILWEIPMPITAYNFSDQHDIRLKAETFLFRPTLRRNAAASKNQVKFYVALCLEVTGWSWLWWWWWWWWRRRRPKMEGVDELISAGYKSRMHHPSPLFHPYIGWQGCWYM